MKKRNHKSKNNPNYKDGRCTKKYFCGCGKSISMNTGIYYGGQCKSCAAKQRRKTVIYKDISGKNNPNFGNHKLRGKNHPMYGKPARNSKQEKYNGINMRSSWETKFAFFLDCSGIKWEYEPTRFYLGDITYLPDFYLPKFDCYIEIKGWWRNKAKKKFDLFEKKHPKINVKVLMEKDLLELGVL